MAEVRDVIFRIKPKTKEAEAALKKLVGDTDQFSTSTKKAGKEMGFLNKTVKQVGAAIAGAFAVQQIASFTTETIRLAKEAQGVQAAFQRLNSPNLLNDLRKATKGTISDLGLMRNAVKAKNFELPLNQLAKLFQFAQQRARETGEDVQFLVDSIVLGIGRKSPLILDNLGISAVRLRKELKGVGTESATVGDIAASVANIIDEEMNPAVSDFISDADKIDQATAKWENFRKEIGDNLLPVLGSISETGARVLGDLTDPDKGLTPILEDYFERLKDVFTDSEIEREKAFGNLRKSIKDLDTDLENLNKEELTLLKRNLNDTFEAAEKAGNLRNFGFIGFKGDVFTLNELLPILNSELNKLLNAIDEIEEKTATAVTLKSLKKELSDLQEALLNTTVGSSSFRELATQVAETEEAIRKAEMPLKKAREEIQKIAKAVDQARKENKKILEEGDEGDPLEGFVPDGEALNKRWDEILKESKKRAKELNKAQEESELEANEQFFESILKRKEAQKEAAKELVNIAKDVAEKALQFRVDAIEAEIDAQEFRVNKAIQLADKGNAEVLEQEEKRLEFLREEREKAVAQQRAFAALEIAANTALTISNIIRGQSLIFAQSGVTAPVTIPIATAALVGAFAVANTLFQPPQFAEGVEMLSGAGSETSDSIPALLSRGERVVPAKTNRDYFPALTAIHNGLVPAREINEFVDNFSSGRKSFNDMVIVAGSNNKGLESKLDSIERAILSKGSSSFSIDERGVHAIVDRISLKQKRMSKYLG